MAPDFHVFLSHNSADKPVVREIAARLEARGLNPWLDVAELRPGVPWQDELEKAMRTTHSAAVFLGGHGVGSWQRPEIRACLSQMVKRAEPVIPVLLPGAPDEPDFGLFLGENTWVDLRGGITEEGIERLVWGITGTKPRPRTEVGPNRSSPRLPPPPRYFGRSAEVEALVAALCAETPRPVPVLGSGGIGKTTVTLAALHDRRVAERFGPRRWFIRCDGAANRETLIGEIATGLGIEPGTLLAERTFQELERERAVLVLDNAETPWEGDPERVEELFSTLAGLSGLVLVASLRGDQRPLGPNWTEAVRIGPLPLPDARDAFVAVAGEQFRNDPDLDRVLEAVDRVPLAVTLLAGQAEGDPDLSILWARWQKERTDLLKHGSGASRLTSLDVSLETSIKCPRMTETARRLLSLLGLLPDGIAAADLPILLPEEPEAASSTLRKVGLAFSQGSRLRVLAPVREYVKKRLPPSPEDLARVQDHYLGLAELGEKVGTEGGADVVQRLSSETGNLEAVILLSLPPASTKSGRGVEAALGLGELLRWTGLGSARPLEAALLSPDVTGNERNHAHCLKRLGDIALYRSDHDAARTRYEEALPLFRRVGSVLGEANCIQRLGDIALRRSDHDAARTRYEEALPLYRRVGSVLGEANCIRSLGDIALRRSDHDAARTRYEEALPLYRRVGDVLGEANCIKSLGDIALARSDEVVATSLFEEALGLYSRIGEPYSMGSTHARLARIAVSLEERSLHVEAARENWMRIKRPDLVAELDQEFASGKR